MIKFAAITPHPPVIIPGIGNESDLGVVKKTVLAMETLREGIENTRPDTLLLISPHASMKMDAFHINTTNVLEGDFTDFGFDRYFTFKNNNDLIDAIVEECGKLDVSVFLGGSFLDHGALVPLYYLAKNIKPKIIHLAFSYLDLETHFRYGQAIRKACQNSAERIAIVASGDLSHRLTTDAPNGYSPKGKEFDAKIIELLEKKDAQGIINMDLDFIEEAGECGLRSIAILLGILGESKWNFRKITYEGPFGVGYLTGKFVLQ